MWKQQSSDAAPASRPSPPTSKTAPAQAAQTPAPVREAPRAPKPVPDAPACLGHSVVIKGQLTGSEDLTIQGRVEGSIESRKHTVIIGEQAQIAAQVFAREVVVVGTVKGDITAGTKIDIREQGRVEGDLKAPTVSIAEGAMFRGGIDMTQTKAESAA